MTGKIFLSYRRDDTAGYAFSLSDQLKRPFPALFMDLGGGIGAGLDFFRVIEKEVRGCDVMLVLIGRDWLTVSDQMGRSRLEDPKDLVRFEVESALRLDKRVIPVLAPKTEMPGANALPQPLAALAGLNAVKLTQERYKSDVQGLIKEIKRALLELEEAALGAERLRLKKEAVALKRGGAVLGRLPRSYDPRIPHYSALVAGRILPPPPAEVDYTKGMPANLGMMLNDTLAADTCAAFYHARQVWSFNVSGGKMETEPDSAVEKLYELACGYKPQQGGEGPGGNIQTVLKYLLRKGAPVGPQGQGSHKINAFVEVDPRLVNDVKSVIAHCGVAYIGFKVPKYIVPHGRPPPAVWNVEHSNTNIVGHQSVVLAGYTSEGARLISWGQYYTMTWPFFSKYVDEVYAIDDSTWSDASGQTPAGLTVAELEQQMQALQG
jgi:hypothetical protein